MIYKKRRQPSEIIGLTALLSRLKPNSLLSKEISSDLAAMRAGLGGEERLDEVLSRHAFPNEHVFLHDLSLKSTGTFQIDTLYLTPSYAVIFEVKNMAGTLTFNENPPQLIRILENGQKRAFGSPAAQIERNQDLFSDWLHARGLALPIYPVIVFAYPKQIIEKPPSNIPVLFPNSVPGFLRRLPKSHTILNSNELSALTKELMDSHAGYIPKPLYEKYNIPIDELKTGVTCKNCGHIGMKRALRTWHCKKCSTNDGFAHEQAITEWFLLVGRKMTNRECRRFLHIDKLQTATRILNMNVFDFRRQFKKSNIHN
ncbi:NERD domain-containing protein [Sporosarcina sp. FSL K6-3457]|uniref:NERD domain-containing protein n=1 Tax=Sporosarcina sp. FSL K6-3457 TaxID=2978204 RepID=UPI0030F96763